MKTKSLQKDKVNIVTLGCSKNLVDSQVLLTQLCGNGIDAAHEGSEANVVIINTCGFIEKAKQESIDTILAYAAEKNEGRIEKLYVTGCLSQRYKDDLEKEIPEVDAYFGTMELPLLLKKFKADYKHELLGERINTTSPHYAYLKISEGCNRPCTFCAIPIMRGRHRSRPIEQLVEEAKNLAKNGTKELLLIAQDSTFYGLDIYRKRCLAELLEALSAVDGVEWIRLHYAYPSAFPTDVLKVMASRKNICNYLDLPLQHAATAVLKRMRRGIDRKKTEALLGTIRSAIPDITLRTTLMVGYPGETEADFAEMCEFVAKMRFNRLGVFTYSHEEGTEAFKVKDDVSEAVKQQRAAEIMRIQEEISAALNAEKIGTVQKVLFDRKESGYFIGRTEADSPEVDNEVLVKADANYVRIGDFAPVKIEYAEAFDLYGKVVPGFKV